MTLLGALACGWGAGPPRPEASPRVTAPLVTEEVTWRLVWTLSYRNPGPEPASVSVEVPLPQDRAPWQEVLEVRLDPLPDREERDAFGNRLAVYDWKDVPPGEGVQGQVTALVRRHAGAVDADSRRERPPDRGHEEFLRAEERILADDPVLVETARALVGGEANPYYRLLRLFDFVRTLDYRLTRESRGDREALRSRVVQCADAAGLLVSLARAQGIPARYVAGVYLRPEEPTTTTTHAWAEAFLEPSGWLPMDPTMGRFEDTRASRIGQLDAPYVVLWEGRGSQGFAASGPGAAPARFRLELHHELVRRVPCPAPVLPVPSLRGSTDLQALLPTGRARELLDRALAEGSAERRLALLREALAAAPESPALYRALVTATPAGPPREALERELAARPPSRVTDYARGLLALDEEQWSRAEALLDRAGSGFAVEHARADLFQRTRQPGRAAEALGRATREAVTARLAEQATALFAALGDQAGLLRVAGEADRLFPGRPEFLLARAQALFRLGREQEALELFQRLRDRRPEDGLPEAALGMLYLEQGRLQDALPHLRAGLEGRLEPGEQAAVRGLVEALERSSKGSGPGGRESQRPVRAPAGAG